MEGLSLLSLVGKLFKYIVMFLVGYLILIFAYAIVFIPLLVFISDEKVVELRAEKAYFILPYIEFAKKYTFYSIIVSSIPISLWITEMLKGEFSFRFIKINLIVGLISFLILGSSVLIKMTYGNELFNYVFFTLIGLIYIRLIYFIFKKKKFKTKIKFKSITKEETKGFIFESEKGRINIANPQRGIFIQGGAGSGKSVNIFEPVISQISLQNYSGILYDFKSPELIDKARYCYFANSSVNFKLVDFKNPNQSNRVNPIHPKYLTKSIVAIEYAQALVNNMIPESIKTEDFWARNTKMIIAGTIWFLKEKHPNYCTLPHVISLLLHTDVYQLLEAITEDYEAGGMVTTLKSAMDRKAENQVAGVLSSVQNALSTLNNKEVFWLLSDNEIDLNLNDKLNPTFLALGNDSSLPNTYAPLISLIISVAVRQMNVPDKQKSIILLDEAPTIFVPNLEQVPATGRSNGISTVLGVQDFSQLVDKYGKDKAEVIISNLGNQFFGRTTNQNTAKMVQAIFSKEDRSFETSSFGSGSSGEFIHLNTNKNRGRNESIQERDRVKISDIIHLNPGEFYGINAEGKPREFIKTQFIQNRINSFENQNNVVTNKEMSDNYFRIIEESKGLI
ncbi:type IV secretion system DNA-binding domain-containing protein [Empedobacter falsenii]|uniref:type IV secretory system conjugative DNA transfer family protein n=1 Tax=Algoriella xinjiangensis TaxID=684065 RepID=UPI000F640A3D|nr:type IV secretion system DNA-binding domain-containing protein [Algoriella xinjiangensis]VDH16681.1 DNA transport protein TraD [Algoriella xinjiangensis]